MGSAKGRITVIAATTSLVVLAILLLTWRMSSLWPNDPADDVFPACEYGYAPSGEVCAPVTP